jgi:Flp pilus assembly pilin Flp
VSQLLPKQVRNQMLFREVNERLRETVGSFEERLEFVCECSNEDCIETIGVTLGRTRKSAITRTSSSSPPDMNCSKSTVSSTRVPAISSSRRSSPPKPSSSPTHGRASSFDVKRLVGRIPLRGIASNGRSADDESMRGLKDWRREDGQTMAEYGVILAVITPAIVAAIALLAFAIAGNLGAVADLFT